MLNKDFLLDHLVHKVDINQLVDTSEYNEIDTEFTTRVSCLVDESSGHRELTNNTGDTLVYNYNVTFPTGTKVEINWFLKDARDENDVLIFNRALVVDVRPYRVPGEGIVGILVLAASREE